jgi:hypothetical protein
LRKARTVAVAVLACFCGALAIRALASPKPIVRGVGPADESGQAPAAAVPDEIQRLLTQLEQLILSGDVFGYLDLVAGNANRARATDFSRSEFQPGATRAVVKERERIPFGSTVTPTGYRVVVDVFAEYGNRARVATWQLDVQRSGEALAVFDQQRLSTVERLFRISLDPDRQFSATNLRIHAEDFDIAFDSGNIFVATIDGGVTALVLLGRGTMKFHPKPDTERTQVRIFCGSETLDAPFTSAFVRVDPGDAQRFMDVERLMSVPVDPRELKRATDLFKQDSTKSYQLSLGDLSTETWSLLPGVANFVAEVHTRRYGILTYARSKAEPEDITLFDRARHRNIAVYSSEETLARRGRFYNEDAFRDYDVTDYNVEVAVSPGRQWIDGVATVALRVTSPTVTAITLRLADALTIRSITSDRFGRLFGFRVNNQNLVVINLPAPVGQDGTLKLTVAYAGRIESQAADGNETLAVAGQDQADVPPMEFSAEPTFLYSSRVPWYPQATSTDYATATLKVSVPPAYDCVASGVLEEGWPRTAGTKDEQSERRIYSFKSVQPLRYLAFIVTKLVHVQTDVLEFAPGSKTMTLSVEANPRQARRGRDMAPRAADIAKFYASLLGDFPYPAFTLALVENDLPGGHSPAYFAELFQPLPMSVLSWRNDPASFDRFPDFFLAHELAHQWFGQAVGWGNYHEQWLSEAFAQYFAALYAQHSRGDGVFSGVLRQMRRWAIDQSDQGPVYLGYRLGHIKGDGRIFRALVYNKGAAVLHMLRLLLGDEAFFGAIRRFYGLAKFRKVGTDDLKNAFEAESGQSLDRFFEQWIYGSATPKIKIQYRVDGTELAVHVDQLGDIFDIPVVLSVEYADRSRATIVVPVRERAVDRRFPLSAAIRNVEVSRDDGVLADFAN